MQKSKIRLSVEYFPPRSAAAKINFDQEAAKIHTNLKPELISITYGASGTDKDATWDTVMDFIDQSKIQANFPKISAHITAAGSSKAQILALAKEYWDHGIRNLVVIRGDAEQGQSGFTPHPEGFRYAKELVAAIKAVADFEIAVGCYPETHPEAKSAHDDLFNLKEKFEAGADFAISQFFFKADAFLRFRDLAQKQGIKQDLVPGILPFISVAQTLKFAKLCATSIPNSLNEKLLKVEGDQIATQALGIEVAATLIEKLAGEGVNRFHLYGLNRSNSLIELKRILPYLFGEESNQKTHEFV